MYELVLVLASLLEKVLLRGFRRVVCSNAWPRDCVFVYFVSKLCWEMKKWKL